MSLKTIKQMDKRNEQQISTLKRKFTLPVLYSVD